jgi:hypothetical protein
MGGDGGTKAVNRAYLRGAGSASTTGDIHKNDTTHGNVDNQVNEQEAMRAMQYCYISDLPLHTIGSTSSSSSSSLPSSSALPSSNIVTCRYGRLYNKEVVIEALLQRKQMSSSLRETSRDSLRSNIQGRLGQHIRGLKDLYNVRFQTIQNDATKMVIPVCPITGRELNGRIIAYALIPGNDNMVNVVSDYALKQLPEKDIMIEYGATKKIRLLSPPSQYDIIDQEYMNECNDGNNNSTRQHKKKKNKLHQEKRQRDDTKLDDHENEIAEYAERKKIREKK